MPQRSQDQVTNCEARIADAFALTIAHPAIMMPLAMNSPKAIGLALAVVLSLCSCVLAPPSFDEAAWRRDVEGSSTAMLYQPHFKDGRFFNPWMPMERGGLGRLVKWRLSRKAVFSQDEEQFLPRVIPDLSQRIAAMPQGDWIAWIGHSTFLLRLGNAYWITDPMLSPRALLPKRLTPPAIDSAALAALAPQINVIISHNHYDHLDADTIRALPPRARFFVPLGLKSLVASWHPGRIEEMDWWQDIDAGQGVTLSCLPAQHWSRRIGQPVNTSLWASFLLRTPTVSVYYGADSGYFVGYREFGRRFAPIDYALLSTTAYHPRWFMHYAHVNIEEALDAFAQIKAGYFIPTQWGTFRLGDEPAGYPALDLKATIARKGLDPKRFLILDIGQIQRLTPAP